MLAAQTLPVLWFWGGGTVESIGNITSHPLPGAPPIAYSIGAGSVVANGSFAPSGDGKKVQELQSHGLSVHGIMGCSDIHTLRALFRRPGPFIADAVAFADKLKLAGFNLDFEPYDGVTNADGAAYAAFVDLFAAALHAQGLQLTVDFFSNGAIWDVAALNSTAVDVLISMDTYVQDNATMEFAAQAALGHIAPRRLGVGVCPQPSQTRKPYGPDPCGPLEWSPAMIAERLQYIAGLPSVAMLNFCCTGLISEAWWAGLHTFYEGLSRPTDHHIPSRRLPGGVELPLLYMGAGNWSEWLGAVGAGAGLKTAWLYGNQQTLMPAVRAAGLRREDVFIETMLPCGVGTPNATLPMTAELAWQYIHTDLRLLGTDYVDLLLVHHRCDTEAETKAVWGAMEQALRNGTARAIGVSNFDVDDLKALQAYATAPVAVNEAHFAVGVMDYEMVAYANEHDIALVSFSSLAAGVPLSHPTVQRIAARHGASAAQVMYAFVAAHNISVLSGISKPEFVAEDLHIFDVHLSPAELQELAALQTGKRTCPDCWTAECQECSRKLASEGCPVGAFPTAGRDNPHSAQCLACAAEKNATVMAVCKVPWMVPKACGQAGGF